MVHVGNKMRILVAITNYGTKNIQYTSRLIEEYRAMSFHVDIVVLSEAEKKYGDGVLVLTGLPTKDPWSLPFGHKKLFADNIEKYDLFIYTEDDTLICEKNIIAFLNATKILPKNFIAGFIRYELYPDGKKNYLDMHGAYHWIPNSVQRSGRYVYARFSNDHSACYMLTQGQLKQAVASGGYLVGPHEGRYDLLCSAGTDPYTQCGFTKVICLSHLQDFELHHLPNAYAGSLGLNEDVYKLQIEALFEILENKRPNDELFTTEKPLATVKWNKSYYEPCRNDFLHYIPRTAKNILSVGCGWGATEAALMESEKHVEAIPIDSIIGKVAESRGIRVLQPDFTAVAKIMPNEKFDAIILIDVLQHFACPVEILTKLTTFMKKDGALLGSVPNLSQSRRLIARMMRKQWARFRGNFDLIKLNLVSRAKIKNWLRQSGFNPLILSYTHDRAIQHSSRLCTRFFDQVVASDIIFLATRVIP